MQEDFFVFIMRIQMHQYFDKRSTRINTWPVWTATKVKNCKTLLMQICFIDVGFKD